MEGSKKSQSQTEYSETKAKDDDCKLRADGIIRSGVHSCSTLSHFYSAMVVVVVVGMMAMMGVLQVKRRVPVPINERYNQEVCREKAVQ